ncbi:hypothetical protein ATE47_00525 [Chryseobacterium sp. IHB B 17019]|uniref:hypothetical protein n=1 Tax=Chryseobacterium sp. IHB B 17019 TaxID=1721091 RepID=UPI0007204A57|nr:hypothetical protein [Chryseobacterium sp. IHB B 17019]ALR29122.1 hypothetical protein ATE47_00525 [Chryseobacterium sp. IHB B 17019]
MKIFDYQNKNGKLIFISKDFPRSTAEKQVKLPKCTVIGYENKTYSGRKRTVDKRKQIRGYHDMRCHRFIQKCFAGACRRHSEEYKDELFLLTKALYTRKLIFFKHIIIDYYRHLQKCGCFFLFLI